jgi:hypothetical protein
VQYNIERFKVPSSATNLISARPISPLPSYSTAMEEPTDTAAELRSMDPDEYHLDTLALNWQAVSMPSISLFALRLKGQNYGVQDLFALDPVYLVFPPSQFSQSSQDIHVPADSPPSAIGGDFSAPPSVQNTYHVSSSLFTVPAPSSIHFQTTATPPDSNKNNRLLSTTPPVCFISSASSKTPSF